MDHDRYAYDSGFVRDQRVEYEDGGARSAASWGADPYGVPRSSWGRYDGSAASTHYHEGPWAVPSSSSYDSRALYDWPSQSSRDIEWAESGSANRQTDRRHADWRGEGRREKGQASKFQSDSGWDTRRRDRAEWDPIHDHTRSEKGPGTSEDRSWEPAPSWKSASGNDHQSQNQRHSNGQKPPQSKSKRNNQKQRREWRTDDSDLNK